MTCEKLVDVFLMDYVAGNLSLARKLDFEVHLGLCAPCRKYLASYKRTILMARQAEVEPVGEPPEELIAAILKVARAG